MQRRTFLIALPLLLTACTATDVVKNVAGAALGTDKGGLTVDTELQNGDKTVNVGETDNSETVVEDNEGTVNIQTTKTDKSFAQAGQVTINESMSPYEILLLGWLIPSPPFKKIALEIKSLFSPKI